MDEELFLQASGHFDMLTEDPPELFIEPKREKRKYVKKEKSGENTTSLDDSMVNGDTSTPSSSSDLDSSLTSSGSDDSSISKMSETDSGYGSQDSSLLSSSDSDESMLHSLTNVEFSTEDQSTIEECINGLHYLPFTFELSRSDISIAFEKTVDKLCDIFQKNSVPLNRDIVRGT